MAVKLVSDIHGAHEALASQLLPGDVLVMLGDYAPLIDFDTLGGIVSDLISKERLIRVLMQVAAGEMEEAEELVADFTLPGGRYYERVAGELAECYRSLFDSIPCETHLIFGNNDFPELLEQCANGRARVLRGEAVDIAGLRFGFVSGSPPHRVSIGLPGDMDAEAYRAQVEALGPVDVLCSHVPPSGMGLEYDTVARRDEAGSEALTEYIRAYQPGYAFHGHVHNPARETAACGATRVRNLGYFRRHGTVLALGDGPGRGENGWRNGR